MQDRHPLLELQRLDLEVDGLRARRAGLPERAAGAERDAALATIASARAEADARAAALGHAEREVETRVADLRARARDVETRLYSGKVKAIKELEGLQLELRDWQRKQGEEETTELALMEQQEALAAEIATLAARAEALAAERTALAAALAARETEIDAALAGILAARAAAGAALEPALLTHYERLRVALPNRGVAAVKIGEGVCLGCHATLPIAFAQTLEGRPPGTAVACPRCGRLLVL
jgi:uncharacterized protein